MQRLQICRASVNVMMFALLALDKLFIDPSNQESSAKVVVDSSREFDFIFGLVVLVPVAFSVGNACYYTRMNRIVRRYFALAQDSVVNSNGDDKNAKVTAFTGRAKMHMMAVRSE